MHRSLKKLLVVAQALLVSAWSFSQDQGKEDSPLNTGDSLTLSQVIRQVVSNHPSIKQAREALNVADAKIGLAKSAYLPDVDVSASYSHIGPVPSFDFPSFGKVSLYPADNYSASVNYRQTLYDFGKTAKSVALENENKTLYNSNIELVQQKLAANTIGCYYALIFLQEAIKIKDDQLKTLQEHLSFIEKKKTTGSATDYELLATQVKISNIESQKTDLESQMKSQLSVLNSLLGLRPDVALKLKKGDIPVLPAIEGDSLLGYAYQNRFEMAISKEKADIANLQYSLARSQNNPSLTAFANGGGKNGYIPELYQIKANYAVGLGIRVPIFDANRQKNSVAISRSAINNADFELDATRRTVTNEVIEANNTRLAASQKIQLYTLQCNQAEQAFKLATVNYKAGTITNLDLLDSETAVSESRLLILKAELDYMVSSYRLKAALGDKLY